jgi:hypothetical protein
MVRSAMVGALAVSWVAAAGGLGGATAAAETVPPAQAVADNGVFLEHAPPPLQPAAVCIVDSGVDLNPDTASQVVFREALDGGDPGDVSPDKHGTLMAMMAAAPVNGWGMVGAAPGAVKIVSVRVEEPGEGTVPYSAYERGITECKKFSSLFGIRTISLSLAGSLPPQQDDAQVLTDAVDSARRYGLDVVAAAGNDSGPVAPPGTTRSVISVGASSSGQTRCPFSNYGEDLGTLAPGCSLDAADPRSGESNFGNSNGTSEATAILSSVLAALRAYRPDLSVDAAEHLLVTNPASALDVRGVFVRAGLSALEGSGRAPAGAYGQAWHPSRHLPKPRIHVAWTRRSLVVSALNFPSSARMTASVSRARRGEFGDSWVVVKRRTTMLSRCRIRLSRRSLRLAVQYVDPRRGRRRSRVTVISLGR